jgi:hypothetical protein
MWLWSASVVCAAAGQLPGPSVTRGAPMSETPESPAEETVPDPETEEADDDADQA